MQALTRLYREARRRKLFRTSALYVVGAWLALQVANTLFPGFGVPDAAIRALFWTAVLGFPLALVFGWLYEIGPGGIRRTLPTDADVPGQPLPLARRDYLILAAFAAIAIVLGYRAVRDIRETPLAGPGPVSAGDAARATTERLANSIAVLPFANISEDSANEYFCDGISEEILNQLGAVGGLTVIGRTSSFAFKGSDYGIDRISALLGVRYVLQGSVRKAADQLRVSAQLLDQSGVQVWAHSFDRRLENVFEIQSEIAAAVAQQVASAVLPQSEGAHQPDIVAYDHYLAGRTLLHRRQSDQARAELERAVAIDPLFAEAHAELAITQAFGDSPEDQERSRQSIERALQLEPRLLRARAAQAFLLMQGEQPDTVGAERLLREVLAQDPNMSDALLWLTNVLGRQGRTQEARAMLERAAKIDPLHPSIGANLAEQLAEEGNIDGARRIYERLLAQPVAGWLVHHTAGDFYRSVGNLAELARLQQQQALREPSFGSLFFLLQSLAVLGDWDLAEAVNDRLMRVPPEGPGRVYGRMILPGLKGQTDIVRDRLRQAYDRHGLTLANLDSFDRVVAGTHLARAGEYAMAIEALEPVVDVAAPYELPQPSAAYSPALHMLAWSYLQTGADAKAARLLASAQRYCRGEQADGRSRDSASLFQCAEVEVLLGHLEPALDGLERAIDAGWREAYVRERDPLWAAASGHPRFHALMAGVKADVDRQRTEVQRAMPAKEFLAKLDAAIARQAATGQ